MIRTGAGIRTGARIGRGAGKGSASGARHGQRPTAAAPASRSGRWRTGLALGLVALTLAGCFADGGLRGPVAPEPALRVMSGAVAIAGPAGYCVDPVSSRDSRRGAFVLMGSCAALNDGRGPARQAALTAAVSPPGDGLRVADSKDALAALFATEEGRALIARSGSADSAQLQGTDSRDGVLYLRIRDDSPFEGAEVTDSYWRAMLDIGPHVVTLSVIPLASRPLRSDAARALLEEFVTRTRAESARPPARPRPRPDPD